MSQACKNNLLFTSEPTLKLSQFRTRPRGKPSYPLHIEVDGVVQPGRFTNLISARKAISRTVCKVRPGAMIEAVARNGVSLSALRAPVDREKDSAKVEAEE